jgi:hypothetical protein
LSFSASRTAAYLFTKPSCSSLFTLSKTGEGERLISLASSLTVSLAFFEAVLVTVHLYHQVVPQNIILLSLKTAKFTELYSLNLFKSLICFIKLGLLFVYSV